MVSCFDLFSSPSRREGQRGLNKRGTACEALVVADADPHLLDTGNSLAGHTRALGTGEVCH